MMHVLCEEYETVYAACLLITSAVLGVDFGYQPTDKGELEYIIQIEPELLDRLKAGEAIQMGLPPNMQKVEVFRVQVGTAELPKVLPTSYSEDAGKKPPLGLTPTDVPPLTAPPEEADNRPALANDDELAQYAPRSARQLPSGASEPAGSAYSSGTAGTGSSIPGAEQRYGGTSSNFSVPESSRFGASQTSGTTPIASGTTQPGTSGSVGNPNAGTNSGATNSGVANSGASVSNPNGSNISAPENRWNPTAQTTTNNQSGTSGQAAGGQANSSQPNSGQQNPAPGNVATNTGSTNNNTPTGSNSDPYRFNFNNSGTGQQAPDLISPSDWTSASGGQIGGTQNNQNGNTPTAGNQYSNNPNGNQNGSPQNGNSPNNGGTVSNGQNGGSFYDPRNPPNGSGQQQNGNTNPLWTNSNLNNGNQAPYSPMPNPDYNAPANGNGQYVPNQNPPYNGQYASGNYPGNGYVQQPPAGYANTAAPYGYNPVTGQPLPAPYPGAPVNYLASLPQNQQSPQQPAPTTQSNTGNEASNNSSDKSDDDKELSSTRNRDDFLPSWWPLLAFGFLVSICANGYMWMISQDFQRKYQDLLEDVRDLRTLSDN